jgi:predicted 2-oxoglutarate/Fe(II)-dependent dioxygenase YbiX
MKRIIAENLFTVPEIFGPQECEDFIARGEGIGFGAASVSTAAGPRMMANVRNNDRVIFDNPALADSIWERIRSHVPQELDGATAVGLNERFRYYRYDPSQRFNAHRDGTVKRSPSERSRLTFMVYLNDGFEGGQTVFYSEVRVNGLRQIVASVEPVRGLGLFFAHGWWHEGARVVSGRKYVLRTDVMYRDTTSVV